MMQLALSPTVAKKAFNPLRFSFLLMAEVVRCQGLHNQAAPTQTQARIASKEMSRSMIVALDQ